MLQSFREFATRTVKKSSSSKTPRKRASKTSVQTESTAKKSASSTSKDVRSTQNKKFKVNKSPSRSTGKSRTAKSTKARSKTAKKGEKPNKKKKSWRDTLPTYRTKKEQLVAAEQLNQLNLKSIPEPNTLPESFAVMKLHPKLVEALKKLNYQRPTPVQAMAIPQLLGGKDALCAAQTGTGKTFAYLLPILHKLWTDQDVPNWRRRGQRMRALILVPYRELGQQIKHVIDQLAQSANVDSKVIVLAGGLQVKENQEFNMLNAGCDILISTPNRFLSHLEAKHISLDDMKFMVIDEADTMLDNPLDKKLHRIVAFLKAEIQNKTMYSQIVVASATITQAITTFAQLQSLNLVKVATSELHHMVKRLDQNFIKVYTRGHKLATLFKLLKSDEHKNKRTIIFCNSIQSCAHVFNQLSENGIQVAILNAMLKPEVRQAAYKSFRDGIVPRLVATDVGSRGLDFRNVEHVILYDMPLNAINYLHRVGRTARWGRSGMATSLYFPYEIPLVEAIQRGDNLEKAPSILSDVEHAIKATGRQLRREKAAEQRQKASIRKFVDTVFPSQF